MSRIVRATVCLLALGSRARGQALSDRMRSLGDGLAQFSFASRPDVCGDGATYIADAPGTRARIVDDGALDDGAPCVHGPVRVVVSLAGGEPTRIRVYVGPSPAPARAPAPAHASTPAQVSAAGIRDLGRVGVAEAVAYLANVAEQAPTRPAEHALLPMLLADSVSVWPTLLALSRDVERPRQLRHQAMFWLGHVVAQQLGLRDTAGDDTADEDVRGSAVFAISQQPKDRAIPELIRLAEGSKYPGVRAKALFWLGQSGDVRAVDLFERLLQKR